MRDLEAHLTALSRELDEAKLLSAKCLIERIKSHGIYDNIQDAEFSVFSQYGDDGIIQYLINNINIDSNSFVEFGVGNYRESNTRFLLVNNHWKGLVMDCNSRNIDYIKKDNIYWRHNLTAVHAFVTKENVNDIISTQHFAGDIGILHIDIDGNDYWIWESISVVSAAIVIVEYNSVFGYRHAITIPYDPVFDRTNSHYSYLYYGCSLKALCLLAARKGYVFVGSNSAGNNAYFVKKERVGDIKQLTVEDGYVESEFRESRGRNGELTFISGDQRREIIADKCVYDLEKGVLVKIKEL